MQRVGVSLVNLRSSLPRDCGGMWHDRKDLTFYESQLCGSGVTITMCIPVAYKKLVSSAAIIGKFWDLSLYIVFEMEF